MSDLTAVEREWAPWISAVAGALEVDAGLVDVTFIHSLTQVVAHEFARPMAPVSAYILGLAAAAHPQRTADELRAAIVGAIPAAEQVRATGTGADLAPDEHRTTRTIPAAEQVRVTGTGTIPAADA